MPGVLTLMMRKTLILMMDTGGSALGDASGPKEQKPSHHRYLVKKAES
jgi:hypothetical protein